MGRRACMMPDLPTKPLISYCINNGDGTAYCNGFKVDATNYVSMPPYDHEALQEYIRDLENIIKR